MVFWIMMPHSDINEVFELNLNVNIS